MGNLCGKPKDASTKKTHKPPGDATSNVKKLIIPTWKSDEPMSVEQLRREREQFWDTQPHYGGNKVIWDALKAICETIELDDRYVIIESAGIIVAEEVRCIVTAIDLLVSKGKQSEGPGDGLAVYLLQDMSVCYDETGCRYDLPKYVLSEPTNLTRK